MISIIPFSIIMVLVPVYATVDDSMVGETATLEEVGLKAETASTVFMELSNLDVDVVEQSKDGNDEKQVGTPHVVRGHPAYTETFQFQAALIVNTSYGYFYICGAVLVSPRRAITAAHCTTYFTGNLTYDHFIGVGILNRSMGLLNPGSQMVRVLQAEDHRKFTTKRGNDIAMLYLEEDIVENKYVHFAKLATPDMGNFDDYTCVISGWGYDETKTQTDILQFGYQYITPRDECRDFWAIINRRRLITNRHICGYYYPTNGCSGDSGGPLTCGEVVVGIVSWGLSSCSGCFPDVYTRLSSFDKWIADRL